MSVRADPGQQWRALAIAREGSGMVQLNALGHDYQFPFRSDLFSYLPKGSGSQWRFPENTGALVIYLPDRLLETVAGGQGPIDERPLIGIPDKQMARMARMLESHLTVPRFASDMIVDSLLRAMIAQTGMRFRAAKSYDGSRHYIAPARLRRIMDYIDANLGLPLTIDVLASEAGLSSYHFARTFRMATGDTPHNFVRLRRLARANELLCADTVPLPEIALACGFSSQAHLTTAFAAEIGITPARLRRRLRLQP